MTARYQHEALTLDHIDSATDPLCQHDLPGYAEWCAEVDQKQMTEEALAAHERWYRQMEEMEQGNDPDCHLCNGRGCWACEPY